MGTHAFDRDIDLLARVHCGSGVRSEGSWGAWQGWNIPVQRFRIEDGESFYVDAADYYTFILQQNGGRVSRGDRSCWADGSDGAGVSIQVPQSPAIFNLDGPASFAAFGVRKSLVEETVMRCYGTSEVAISDSFTRQSPSMRAALKWYAKRASDIGDAPASLEMDSIGYLLVIACIKAAGKVSPREDVPGRRQSPLDKIKMRRVTDMIEAQLGEPITADAMAKAADLSTFHFVRAFRAATGETPHSYIMGRRLERAKCLLEGRAMSLAEIAHATGFSSQSHFTTRFREAYGVAPGAYRLSEKDGAPLVLARLGLHGE